MSEEVPVESPEGEQRVIDEGEEWINFRGELRGLRTDILKKLLELDNKSLYEWYYEQERKLIEIIRSAGHKEETCLAWHILAQGGTSRKDSPILDFPDEYSVRSFYQSILKEINNK